jgi:NADP-dependent 3-hydroxy acid dehydrogenase YdfG
VTDDPLRNRTVVVTGGSSGIGSAIAAALAGAGAWVAMVARSEERLRDSARRAGGHPVVADASTEVGVDAIGEAVRESPAGTVDIVVNSAGAFALAPFAETDPESFDAQVRSNLRAPFLLIRRVLPAMVERGSGHIVNIGSIAGRVPLPGNAGYSATKYGLRGLHEVLAEEVRGSGVRVTMIEPAATDTSLWDELDPDSRSDLPSRVHMLRPEDVARAVLFVVSQPEGVEVSHLAIRAT